MIEKFKEVSEDKCSRNSYTKKAVEWFLSPFDVNKTTFKDNCRMIREVVSNSDGTRKVIEELAAKENLTMDSFLYNNHKAERDAVYSVFNASSKADFKRISKLQILVAPNLISVKGEHFKLKDFVEARLKELSKHMVMKVFKEPTEEEKKEELAIMMKRMRAVSPEAVATIDKIGSEYNMNVRRDTVERFEEMVATVKAKYGNEIPKIFQRDVSGERVPEFYSHRVKILNQNFLLDPHESSFSFIKELNKEIAKIARKNGDLAEAVFKQKVLLKLTGIQFPKSKSFWRYSITNGRNYIIEVNIKGTNLLELTSKVIVNTSILGNEFYQYPFTYRLNKKAIGEANINEKIKEL